MKSVILFDPSIRSLNLGDHIIMESAKYELDGILENKYVVHCGTHSPAVTMYQNNRKNSHMRFYDDATYKFICGSNLLWKNLFLPRPTFNINPFNCMPYENSVLLGVGTNRSSSKTNLYTQHIYRKILSNKFIHSVRDEATKKFVESLGYEALNTGCPTMWRFTDTFCGDIPHEKAEDVVFTLTDYGQDRQADQKLINILLEEYRNVYFWIQGAFDKEYFDQFDGTDKIKIVEPSLSAYSNILEKDNIEYVGTRLHAGIYAMQHKKRTIILTIDDRVRDMKETYALNTLERKDIEHLPDFINSSFETHVCVNEEAINLWLSQF